MAVTSEIVLQVDCEQEYHTITTKRKQTIDDTFRMIDVYMYSSMHTDIVFFGLEIFQEIICSHSCLNIFLYNELLFITVKSCVCVDQIW